MGDLRTIRKDRLRLTQEQLATQLGVSQATISRFETGELPLDDRTSLAVEALVARAERAVEIDLARDVAA